MFVINTYKKKAIQRNDNYYYDNYLACFKH